MKQQRRQDILDTTWKLFQETSYQAITMAEVAEKTGLAKGTTYLYFKTKEELFLSIQVQQFDSWFDEIDAHLEEAAANKIHQIGEIAKIICRTLEERTALTRLLAILHSVLEQNIDFDTALQFKKFLRARLTTTGANLEKCLPFLEAGQGATVLLRIYALIIGLQHLADPSPIVRQALQEPGMAIMQVDFKAEFSQSVAALLYGVEYEANQKKAE